MCGRYRLHRHWERDLQGDLRLVIGRIDVDTLVAGSDEARPRDRMPILRRDADGALVPDLRRWGFIIRVDGKSTDRTTGKPKKLRRDVFNAMGEKLASGSLWRCPFRERRCLVPMSSWDEWPETAAGKQRVRVSMPGQPVFCAAGLYDTSVDPKSGERVAVFTTVTVPPSEFLGTVHDRAPMVLQPSQYQAWLDGGAPAQALLGVHPDASAFRVEVVAGPGAPDPPG